MVKDLFLVGIGGALGSMLRYGISLIFVAFTLPSSIATLVVNIIGSFAIGVLISACGKGSLYLLLTVGLCGGFTTFSTFSAQTIELFVEGKYLTGLLYVLTTILLCLIFTGFGLCVGKLESV